MTALFRPAAVLFAMAALAGALLLSSGPASAATTTVAVGDLYFCSASFENGTCTTTITAGDTVTWDMGSATASHSSTSDTGVWDSGTIAPGGSYSHTFSTAGSFPYHCNIHPTQMHGVIVVQAAAAPSATAAAGGGTTPATGSTPRATTAAGGALPVSGQGPQSESSDWLLVAALAVTGASLGGLSVVFARRRVG